eukprot:1271585-Rhodomonas_salina.1
MLQIARDARGYCTRHPFSVSAEYGPRIGGLYLSNKRALVLISAGSLVFLSAGSRCPIGGLSAGVWGYLALGLELADLAEARKRLRVRAPHQTLQLPATRPVPLELCKLCNCYSQIQYCEHP